MNRGAALALIVMTGCTTRVTCPNGDVVIPQSVEKTFPAYFQVYEGTLKATYTALDRMSVSAEADVRAQLSKLRNDLDQQSSQLEMICKLAMVGLQTMPCDPTARENYWRALALVNDRTRELGEIRRQIEEHPVTTKTLKDADVTVAAGTEEIQTAARQTNPQSLQAAIQRAEAAAAMAESASQKADAAANRRLNWR